MAAQDYLARLQHAAVASASGGAGGASSGRSGASSASTFPGVGAGFPGGLSAADSLLASYTSAMNAASHSAGGSNGGAGKSSSSRKSLTSSSSSSSVVVRDSLSNQPIPSTSTASSSGNGNGKSIRSLPRLLPTVFTVRFSSFFARSLWRLHPEEWLEQQEPTEISDGLSGCLIHTDQFQSVIPLVNGHVVPILWQSAGLTLSARNGGRCGRGCPTHRIALCFQ